MPSTSSSMHRMKLVLDKLIKLRKYREILWVWMNWNWKLLHQRLNRYNKEKSFIWIVQVVGLTLMLIEKCVAIVCRVNGGYYNVLHESVNHLKPPTALKHPTFLISASDFYQWIYLDSIKKIWFDIWKTVRNHDFIWAIWAWISQRKTGSWRQASLCHRIALSIASWKLHISKRSTTICRCPTGIHSLSIKLSKRREFSFISRDGIIVNKIWTIDEIWASYDSSYNRLVFPRPAVMYGGLMTFSSSAEQSLKSCPINTLLWLIDSPLLWKISYTKDWIRFYHLSNPKALFFRFKMTLTIMSKGDYKRAETCPFMVHHWLQMFTKWWQTVDGRMNPFVKRIDKIKGYSPLCTQSGIVTMEKVNNGKTFFVSTHVSEEDTTKLNGFPCWQSKWDGGAWFDN